VHNVHTQSLTAPLPQPNIAVVLGATDKDVDGLVVVLPPKHVIDEATLKLSLAAYSGWNLPVLSLMTT
jgi:hypothetical protein